MTKNKLGILAIAAAVFAGACADATSPRMLAIDGVSSAVATSPTFTLPAGMAFWGTVRVCKAIAGDDPAQQFSYTATVTPIIDAGPALAPINFTINAVPGQTVCTNAFVSTQDGGRLDRIVVVENNSPANWTLSNIDVLITLSASGYSPPVPGLTDSESEATRSATVYSNDDMARTVTFTNDYRLPEEPICDFITFGRLVTEIGGKKVVISGNAGGNNADGSIKNEFHIEYLDVDYHVADAITYGPITSGALFGLANSRVVTGNAKNGTAVELRLWDGGEPGKGTDMVWFSLNGSVKTLAAGQFIDQGNMQYHSNCRGPKS